MWSGGPIPHPKKVIPNNSTRLGSPRAVPGAAPICHPTSLLQLVCTHRTVLSPVYPMYGNKGPFPPGFASFPACSFRLRALEPEQLLSLPSAKSPGGPSRERIAYLNSGDFSKSSNSFLTSKQAMWDWREMDSQRPQKWEGDESLACLGH
ncbi:hypothetical protein H8959_019125 [Pygathrix nigripes]